MKALLNRLPRWAEFTVVVGGAFGYFIVSALFVAFHPDLITKPHHTNGTLIALGIAETVMFAVLGSFLWVRGWTPSRVGLKPTWPETGTGVGLAFVAYMAYFAAWFAFALLAPGLLQSALHVVVVTPGISLATALIIPWINGFYEELFVAGYIITALKDRRSLWFAVNVSVAIRLLYHLYQGVLGVVVIVPLGLVFGYWYARNGRLWPLIVAHAVIDLIGMLANVKW